MNFHSLKGRTSRGFGLLEVILVFAIVIGAAAVTFSVYQSAKPTADIANAVAKMTTITGNLKSTFGVNHSYRGISTQLAIQAQAIPADMVTDATHAHSQWGSLNVYMTSNTQFALVYANVPSDACTKLVMAIQNLYRDVTVKGTPVIANGVVDTNAIVTQCGAGPAGIAIISD